MPTNIVECGQKIQALLEEFGCKFEIQHNVVLISTNPVEESEVTLVPAADSVASVEGIDPVVTILDTPVVDVVAETSTETPTEATSATDTAAEPTPEVA